MLSVYTRHAAACQKKDDPSWRRCRCPKWIAGTLAGRARALRFSAKTRSWEKAEQLARRYEIAATTGEEVERTPSLPTVKEAVNAYLADAAARGLATGTIEKLVQIFKKQMAAFADQHRIVFLRDFNPRNLTEWRSTWGDRALSKKKKFERVVGFFWFCVRQGWICDNPTASMGRIIARQVPTDYFTADEYARILSATYRLDECAERSWGPEKRGIRIRALTELMRWSGLRCASATRQRWSARGWSTTS
jgi:integrase